MRVSAGLSRLSVSITSGIAVTAVAAGGAIDALSIAAIGVVGAGCVAHSCGSCQPECDEIFHMAPLRIISRVLAASDSGTRRVGFVCSVSAFPGEQYIRTVSRHPYYLFYR
jgi:hypothetical protein